MSDVPPKIMKERVVGLTGRSGTAPLAAGADGSLAKEGPSLPVLQAFQEFLEIERRRTRNRMLILTAFFLLMLIGVGGGGFLLGMVFFNQMAQDVREVQDEIKGIRGEAADIRGATRAAMASFVGETENIRRDIIDGQKSLLSVKSEISAQVSAADDELRDLKQVVALLDSQHSALRQQLDELKAPAATPSPPPDAPAATESAAVAPAQTPTPSPDTPSEFGSPPGPTETLTFMVSPAGVDRAVSVRIPLPE